MGKQRIKLSQSKLPLLYSSRRYVRAIRANIRVSSLSRNSRMTNKGKGRLMNRLSRKQRAHLRHTVKERLETEHERRNNLLGKLYNDFDCSLSFGILQDWYCKIDKLENDLNNIDSLDEALGLAGARIENRKTEAGNRKQHWTIKRIMDLWPSYGLILTKSDQAVLLGLPYERAPVNAIFHMERLSPMEVEVFLDRRKFMERFMEVCAQYTTSNKQLSPISTQIIYLFRIYQQLKGDLVEAFEQVVQLGGNNYCADFWPVGEAQATYFIFLLNKNFIKAFSCGNALQLPLEKASDMRRNSNMGQDYKKSKISAGHNLSQTPLNCSMCLSHYEQSYNPLHQCGKCGIKSHKICFDFAINKCENCRYLRECAAAQNTNPCLICKKNLQSMFVKIGTQGWAHGFCLIAHGFWRVTAQNSFQKIDLSFYQSIQSLTTDLLKIDTRFSNAGRLFDGNEQLEESQMQNQSKLSQQILASLSPAAIQQVPGKDQHNPTGNKQNVQAHHCSLCAEEFYEELMAKCSSCKQVFHGMCAYVLGCDIVPFSAEDSSYRYVINVNCCIFKQWQAEFRKSKFKHSYLGAEANRRHNQEIEQPNSSGSFPFNDLAQ